MLRVPEISGLSTDSAKVQLVTGDLNVRFVETPVASAQQVGNVAYTFPAAGESVPRGSIIDVFISSGGQQIMPDVSGLDLQAAYTTLEVMGFFPTPPQPSQYWMLNLCDPNLPAGSAHSTFLPPAKQ